MFRSCLPVVLSIAALGVAIGETGDAVSPKLAPGYTPQLDQTERGLWMEVAELEDAIRSSPLLVRDEKINAYVREVACRVAGDYCKDLRIYIVRNPNFNASMAPNGMMQLWTGLLLRVGDEDELASVIAHEMAHYVMAHTLSQYQRIITSTGIGSLFSLGIGVAIGVVVPIGELAALADAMAFSRSQETEADLLGTEFLARAGYDPHAAYRVWENLLAEEHAAVVKREKSAQFLRTHPGAEERAKLLKRRVLREFPLQERERNIDRHSKILMDQYLSYMEDQIDTNRYGRTDYLLKRHAETGIDRGLVEFIRGEMYRQRGKQGDMKLASNAYRVSIETGSAPAEAFRNLGYLLLKAGDRHKAETLFHKYLEHRPNASDRQMIEFYLQEKRHGS